MGKALSGELSSTGTGLVDHPLDLSILFIWMSLSVVLEILVNSFTSTVFCVEIPESKQRRS